MAAPALNSVPVLDADGKPLSKRARRTRRKKGFLLRVPSITGSGTWEAVSAPVVERQDRDGTGPVESTADFPVQDWDGEYLDEVPSNYMQKDHRNGSEESQDDRYKEFLWDNVCPAMPCRAKSEGHREKKPFVRPPYNAAVARPVGKKEAAEDPDAVTAVKAEWQRLRARKAWGESKVRE